jgi:hypothetical protein
MEEYDIYFSYFPVEKQDEMAKAKGISREEYLKKLAEYEEYLANETEEQFEEILKAMPPSTLNL